MVTSDHPSEGTEFTMFCYGGDHEEIIASSNAPHFPRLLRLSIRPLERALATHIFGRPLFNSTTSFVNLSILLPNLTTSQSSFPTLRLTLSSSFLFVLGLGSWGSISPARSKKSLVCFCINFSSSPLLLFYQSKQVESPHHQHLLSFRSLRRRFLAAAHSR
jgi:hypothetical protein